MDFLSIMEAAQGNKVKAQHTKEGVLKTKLTAPKKDKKKVDVAAIKQRLEDEKKRKEAEEKKLERQKKESAGPRGKTYSNGINKQTTRTPVQKPTAAETQKKLKEKQKYENKEHEQKHKQFMSKIEKIGSKNDKKSSEKKSNGSNSAISKKPDDRRKLLPSKRKKPSIVAPPSFADLMKMAEKVKADPSAASVTNNTSHDKVKDKHDASKRKDHPDKGNQKQSSEREKSSHKTSKHSNQDTKPSFRPSSSNGKHKTAGGADRRPDNNDRRSESTNKQHGREDKPTEKGGSNRSTMNGKRPAGGGRTEAPPIKRPALSEAAMAKLAYKSGKRPIPPAPSRPANTQYHTKQTSTNTNAKSSHQIQKSKSPATTSNHKTEAESKPKGVYDQASGVSAWDRLMGNSNKSKDNNVKKKKKQSRYIDSDEEDDDLDDFIDDGEDDIDYSAAIRDIFGYDKSRYRDEDFDDRSMVAGYADIMKEEVRSAKIGREEDLRDMEQEELDRKRKLMRKNKK